MFFLAYISICVKTMGIIFVVLFSGIWDVLSNQEVVDFVRSRIAQRMEPEMVSDWDVL